MNGVLLLIAIVVGQSPGFAFGEPAPERRPVGATATTFNRIDAGMRIAVEERAKHMALLCRTMDDVARRQCIRANLVLFVEGKCPGFAPPWMDAEVSFLDSACEDAARPYDIAVRAPKLTPAPRLGPPPEDFAVKRWHSGNVRGVNMMVWATRDPSDPSRLLVNKSEQTPDVQAQFARGDMAAAALAAPPPPMPMATYAPAPVRILEPSSFSTAAMPFASFGRDAGGNACVGGACGAPSAPMMGGGFSGGGGLFRGGLLGGGGCAGGSCGR